MFSFLVPIVSEVYGAGIGIFVLLIIIVTFTVAKHVARGNKHLIVLYSLKLYCLQFVGNYSKYRL